MAASIVLFDVRKNDFPSERGAVFRTLQVYRCEICGARTNRAVIGGYPGYGLRVPCPNAVACWHHELEQKTRLLGWPHPRGYRAALVAEIRAAKTRARIKIVHDVAGPADRSVRGYRVTNTWAYAPGSRCRHDLERS